MRVPAPIAAVVRDTSRPFEPLAILAMACTAVGVWGTRRTYDIAARNWYRGVEVWLRGELIAPAWWCASGFLVGFLAFERIIWRGRDRQGALLASAAMLFSLWTLWLISLIFSGDAPFRGQVRSEPQMLVFAVFVVGGTLASMVALAATRRWARARGPVVAVGSAFVFVSLAWSAFHAGVIARRALEDSSLQPLHRELTSASTTELLRDHLVSSPNPEGCVLLVDRQGVPAHLQLGDYFYRDAEPERRDAPALERLLDLDGWVDEHYPELAAEWRANTLYFHLGADDTVESLRAMIARGQDLFPDRPRAHVLVRFRHDPWEWRTLVVGIGRPKLGTLPIELSEIEGAPTLELHRGRAEGRPPPGTDPSLGINLRPDSDLSMRDLVGALDRLREAGWKRVALR